MNDWTKYIQNPKGMYLKKFAFEILKERYGHHEQVLERIGHYLVTDKDLEDFSKLLVEVYEVAYLKAVNDHKDALASMGLKATVVPENQKKPGGLR